MNEQQRAPSPTLPLYPDVTGFVKLNKADYCVLGNLVAGTDGGGVAVLLSQGVALKA
jgi:hypothetical protein